MDQNRYFIGIQLPDDLSNTISHLQQKLYDKRVVLDPLIPHITLLHPNVLTTLAPLYFIPRVKEVSSPFLPFTITLTSINLFGRSVLHLAVDSPRILQLHDALVAILPDKIRAQYYVGRSYTPHVTLCQAKTRQQLPEEIINTYNASLEAYLPYSFSVSKITYFVWEAPRKYKIATIA